jgi:hypothetical protein
MADKLDDRSLGELFAELSRETGTLVRKEVELATREMTTNLKQAGAQAGMVAAGGALAHAGLLVLLGMVVMALTQMGMTPWLAALIVGLLTVAIGYFMATRAITNIRRTNIAPVQTIETLKENARWTTGQRA